MAPTSTLITPTLAIATLMYPPQLTWFPDNGPYPYYNYTIRSTRSLSSCAKYVGFPAYSVCKSTKGMYDRYGQQYRTTVKSYRWEHWCGTNDITRKKFSNFM